MGGKIKHSAFTLVETILAVTIIGLVITSTAQLTQSSLHVGNTSMTRFAAYHIAEEGLEIVRAIRDGNWLRNASWKLGLIDGAYFIVDEKFPWTLQKITDDAQAPEIVLGSVAKFKRTISIVSVPGPLQDQPVIRVTSIVHYKDRGKEREVEIVAELTDWKKGPL